ncbi:MAG: M3 family oligoendopeptidase [Candidatus Paceibacterota bacterium]
MPKTKNIQSNSWDLTPLYRHDQDPKIELDLAKHKKNSYHFIDKWHGRSDYLESLPTLKQALLDYEAWLDSGGILGEVGYYFSLRSAQEENNPKIKARLNKINDLATKISNDSQFFTLSLAKIKPKLQKEILKNKDFTRWHYFLKGLFDDAKYLLSEPEEKILALKSAPAKYKWIEMTSSLLTKETREVLGRDGKKHTLPFAEIMGLLSHSNKKIRDTAFLAVNTILDKYADVAEAEINAILLDKKINDELRGLPRPDTSRHLADDIPTEVVDTLIKEVRQAYTLSKKYYTLKAKLFKKKKLDYHERNVPFGQLKKEYTYQDSLKLVDKVFYQLDPEFHQHFQNFTLNKQIDAWPQAGKTGGAFCAYNRPSSPVYILLNHTNELQDVLTIAHEAGHGINDEFMKKNQTALYFGTPLVTAEVASTFCEDFVLEELLTEANDELRLSLLMSKLNDDISTIIRQVAAYSFEQELHATFREVGYLAKEDIGQIFQKHMKSYMGPSINYNPGTENWWIYWSHFRNFFYVYSYASGLLISKSMQAKYKQNKNFMNKIKTFLKAGSSMAPDKLFLAMDIDIKKPQFWQDGLDEVAKLLTETEKLAKKIGHI